MRRVALALLIALLAACGSKSTSRTMEYHPNNTTNEASDSVFVPDTKIEVKMSVSAHFYQDLDSRGHTHRSYRIYLARVAVINGSQFFAPNRIWVGYYAISKSHGPATLLGTDVSKDKATMTGDGSLRRFDMNTRLYITVMVNERRKGGWTTTGKVIAPLAPRNGWPKP